MKEPAQASESGSEWEALAAGGRERLRDRQVEQDPRYRISYPASLHAPLSLSAFFSVTVFQAQTVKWKNQSGSRPSLASLVLTDSDGITCACMTK